MRLFSFFLPQYHEIPENNEWWGKGFTEWVNVKKACPLYKKHVQPKHPKDGHYYDLLDKETVEWQTKLMREPGVTGMVYYHYYFCGRKLLEKPAENLLKWTDIEQPFFFCWANHSWNRSWNGSREVLLEQTYGTEGDWEDHFNYLLPFFKDARYEKVDNKPVFMIFASAFPEKKKMFDYFEKRCKEQGFDGIYLIETINDVAQIHNLVGLKNDAAEQTQKFFLREPTIAYHLYHNSKNAVVKFIRKYYFAFRRRILKKVEILKGDKLVDCIIKREPFEQDYIHGLFFGWDNTPRHGRRGFIIESISKNKFDEYMKTLAESPYVFINAWNEWAEGMMLEPTEEEGSRYLDWIQDKTWEK